MRGKKGMPAKAVQPVPPFEQTVAEIERRYPDQWVLVEIIRDHKQHERVRGRLLAHDHHRDALDAAQRSFRTDYPTAHVYEFFTGAVVAPGVVAAV